MGLFRRKADPITERAKLLDEQIKALEAEIHKLNVEQEKKPATPANGSPFSAPALAPAPAPAPAPQASPLSTDHKSPRSDRSHIAHGPGNGQPRLRSTAFPHSPAAPAHAVSASVPAPAPVPQPAAVPQEPIFEEDQARLQAAPEANTPAHYNELGVRKYDLTSAWQRLKNQVRGPVTSNPKLVHYLSAGSIQGLRPLRYEKRVARNRVIVLAAVLVLALWGVIAIVIGRH